MRLNNGALVLVLQDGNRDCKRFVRVAMPDAMLDTLRPALRLFAFFLIDRWNS